MKGVQEKNKQRRTYRNTQHDRATELRRRPGNTDRHFISTASCGYTLLAQPIEKLGYNEIETNISRGYENLAIFSRRKLVIFLHYYI